MSGKGGDGVDISHLLFVGDMLILCKPNHDQLTYLSWLLIWFEAISRLSINLEKSKLILVGRMENVEELALKFGCKVGALPSSYLGVPLGAPFKSMVVWDGIEERSCKKLVM